MADPRKITEIWAWVVTTPEGDEGIPSAPAAGLHMPMIGGDEERVRSLEHLARAIAATADMPIQLVRFTHREVVEGASN